MGSCVRWMYLALAVMAGAWVGYVVAQLGDISVEGGVPQFHFRHEELVPAVPLPQHPIVRTFEVASGSVGEAEEGEKGESGGKEVVAAKQPRGKLVSALDGFNLRGLRCYDDWEARVKSGVGPVCVDTDSATGAVRECGASVTPSFLNAAESQGTCHDSSYYCTVECGEGEVKWFAHPCGGAGQDKCPLPGKALPGKEPARPGLRGGGVEVAASREKGSGGAVVDLRGLQCELKEGQELCFMEDSQGREVCPPHVTAAFLTEARNQHLCKQAVSTHYCTVACQSGNPDVRWNAHEHAWCKKHQGSCPPVPDLIPIENFQLQPWSEKPRPLLPCASLPRQPGAMEHVSVTMLTFGTKEMATLRDTLETYEKNGLFASAKEFLVYINARAPVIDAEFAPYMRKYPAIRLLGDEKNHGIAGAINKLVEAATQKFVLFLEKDFQLVDPLPCVHDQIAEGKHILDEGIAHVVRYRSRDRPGRPNWAERMFRGQEETVFSRGQPNLFCNHYYWIPDPEQRWPDKINVCHTSRRSESKFYCSKAFYCNWTNNPFLIHKEWWIKEYVESRFKQWTRVDPFQDLESYMNWEPDSWNSLPWIVAQGDGLFKHVDRNNFGF